jgi:photosystem II stability/assembly factor-like uncharacterized protein
MNAKPFMAIFSFLPLLLAAQNVDDGWHEIGNSNYNAAFTDLAFKDNNNGFAIGKAGAYLRTQNGGVTWTAYPSGTIKDLNKIQFLDEDTGFISGGNRAAWSGMVLKTMDGGNQWDTLDIPIGFPYVFDMHFVNQQTGFVTGNWLELWVTLDGGQTWEAKKTLPYDGKNVFFLDENTGFVISNSGKLLKTDDQGDSWREIAIPGMSYLRAICFPTKDTGYAWDNWQYFSKTTDGGETWQQEPISLFASGGYDHFGLLFKDKDTGFAYSQSGYLARTTNGGQSWELVVEDSGKSFHAITVKPDGNLVSVGGGGLFMTSQDGNSWLERARGHFQGTMNSLALLSDETAYAAGENGNIVRTDDAGSSWTKIPLDYPYKYTFMHLEQLTEDQGFICGAGHVLFRTGDGWASFETSNVPPNPATKVLFLNSRKGFLSGSPGMLRTNDGGESWTEVNGFAGKYHDVFAVGQDTLFAVNVSGVISRSFDGGDTWEHLNTNLGYLWYDARLFFVDGRVGFLVESYGNQIFRTTDHGASWTLVHTAGAPLHRAYFDDHLTGYAVGDRGTVLKTADGGNTWVKVTTNTGRNLRDIQFSPGGTGFIIGQDGIVLRRATSYSIQFTISDTEGQTVEDAVITLNDIPYTAGHYSFSGLFPGVYSYRVTRQGYASASGTVTITDSDVQVDIILEPGYKSTFFVANAYTGQAIEGAEAILEGHGSGSSNSAGVVIFDNLEGGGTYQWEVVAPHYLGKSGTFTMAQADATIDVLLDADLSTPVATEASSVLTSGFTAHWQAVEEADAYLLYVSSDGFATHLLNGVSVSANQYRVDGVDYNTTYQYRVKALNQYGTSDFSNAITVNTPDAPAGPVALEAADVTDTSFLARWEGYEGAGHYQVFVSDDGFQSHLPAFHGHETTQQEVLVPGLLPATAYHYRVRVFVTGVGLSHYSNAMPVTTTDVSSGFEAEIKDGLLVYPNPADSRLNLRNPGGPWVAEIFSLKGEWLLRMEGDQPEGQIDVSWIPSGVYLLQVLTGQEIHRQKLVITRSAERM